jgi:hypothetical protein
MVGLAGDMIGRWVYMVGLATVMIGCRLYMVGQATGLIGCPRLCEGKVSYVPKLPPYKKEPKTHSCVWTLLR